MTFFAQYHRRALEADGYTVFAPDEDQPLPIFDEAQAVKFLRTAGYAVIRARVPQPPCVGTCWMPTRGKFRNGKSPKLSPRWVRSVGVDALSYTTTPDGLATAISARSWIRWIQRTRAVRA